MLGFVRCSAGPLGKGGWAHAKVATKMVSMQGTVTKLENLLRDRRALAAVLVLAAGCSSQCR